MILKRGHPDFLIRYYLCLNSFLWYIHYKPGPGVGFLKTRQVSEDNSTTIDTHFSASCGSLQWDMLRYLRLSVVLKNFLKDIGASLLFLLLKGFLDIFK
jgi:hypothetical protein